VAEIYSTVQREDNNMDVVRLEKVPRVAVYVPPNFQPWDDAVTLALEYAEIPYEKVWDEEVLGGVLSRYDWLHLHHEDFTGQYGKFYASFAGASWYQDQQVMLENEARKHGFKKVSELAAEGVDICAVMYDSDPPDVDMQKMLDYGKCLAFTDFTLEKSPYRYEYSDIDQPPSDLLALQNPKTDYFTLFEFSAKFDPVPTMLTQNHVNVIKGFLGQTTSFKRDLVKNTVIILAEREGRDQVRYLHGNYGRGTFTFYSGHDPEDYQHAVGDPPTDLSLHKTSPGYRLILNNILFPAAKKKQQKT
jgi:hypothetical protein